MDIYEFRYGYRLIYLIDGRQVGRWIDRWIKKHTCTKSHRFLSTNTKIGKRIHGTNIQDLLGIGMMKTPKRVGARMKVDK